MSRNRGASGPLNPHPNSIKTTLPCFRKNGLNFCNSSQLQQVQLIDVFLEEPIFIPPPAYSTLTSFIPAIGRRFGFSSALPPLFGPYISIPDLKVLSNNSPPDNIIGLLLKVIMDTILNITLRVYI